MNWGTAFVARHQSQTSPQSALSIEATSSRRQELPVHGVNLDLHTPLLEKLKHATMQEHGNMSSRRTPPPDVVRSSQVASPPQPPSSHPEFLIIGLFALRLTKRLIQGLEYYPGRDDDISWLTNFLVAYPIEFALAKISGARKEDYIATYREIVSRMKRQPRYPIRFMQMNPDNSMQQQQGNRGLESEGTREMTDRESQKSARNA
jgi:hypothetical protein